MDQITLERIRKMHPKLRESLLSEYQEINSMLPKGVRLRFAYTYRTPQEQHAIFLQRPRVTKADSWQSIHNYGLAFDIVLLYDKDNNETFETASWEVNKYWKQVATYFKSKGWEWGGDWKNFKDYPHFQKSYGCTWQELKHLIDNGNIISDGFIKYPKLTL